jgi:hypothetical protein
MSSQSTHSFLASVVRLVFLPVAVLFATPRGPIDSESGIGSSDELYGASVPHAARGAAADLKLIEEEIARRQALEDAERTN